MLSSVMSTLGDRIDAKFLIAYGLPAFTAVLGAIGILTALVGPEQLDYWVHRFDAVEQALGLVLLLLLLVMLAFIFRTLTRPIVGVFAGSASPRSVIPWATQGKCRTRRTAVHEPGPTRRLAAAGASAAPAPPGLDPVSAQDAAEAMPTRLGQVLAAAVDYPRLLYGMDGAVWWTRLVPLLPTEFRTMLGSAYTPLLALLNLSLVFGGLALVGAAVLAVAGKQWPTALSVLFVGLLLAQLCYRAAVSEASEVGSFMRVAFDLYRHAILTQMGEEAPSDLTAERVLWQHLTDQMLHLPASTEAGSDESEAAHRARNDRTARS